MQVKTATCWARCQPSPLHFTLYQVGYELKRLSGIQPWHLFTTAILLLSCWCFYLFKSLCEITFNLTPYSVKSSNKWDHSGSLQETNNKYSFWIFSHSQQVVKSDTSLPYSSQVDAKLQTAGLVLLLQHVHLRASFQTAKRSPTRVPSTPPRLTHLFSLSLKVDFFYSTCE